ncbi:hydrogen gas-evolving membrane-bound hydrogenase subunit E [Bacilliculturomica massiliensis]|uniref:hydrogen gas-evolving membrane-bound hydrogenase subunit E n=1 Tax=Bacilliculturomica massiliensis TaxID=1917867 RepID=UPI0010313AB2|nr:hydrogen gas-evolving membrane-bound hydrogenase subunit E [Bacilliculturomica massiliensis]
MLFAYVLTPFAAALLLLLCQKWIRGRAGWFVLPVPAALFALYLFQMPVVAGGGSVRTEGSWVPLLDLNLSFELSGLSALFSLLITFVGMVVIFYSIFYLSKKERLIHFYIYLLMFMGAMLGVVTADNLLILYLFWELTSVSSFLLIGFWFEKERSRYGAQKAMLITVSGGFCMLVAFVLIGSVCGTFEISAILAQGELLRQSALYPAVAVLIMLGAFTKSAQVPFHIWLPSAMEAPTPISCYLHSATMVKAGIFLLARFTPLLGGTVLWNTTVTGVGLISLLFGSFMALRQKDLKALLAYSTISQLGLIISLFGMGTEAAVLGGLFHLINHSAFKGSLFLMTGIVDHETGTRDMTLLRGLGKAMPFTGAVAFIGSCAMAGLPPFSGFLSKEMFFEAAADAPFSGLSYLGAAAWLVPAAAVLASLFTFVYSLSIFGKVFLGKELTSDTPKHPHEAPAGMLLPAFMLVSLNLVFALAPNFFGGALVAPAAKQVLGLSAPPHLHIAFWHGITPALMMTAAVVAAGALLYSRLGPFRRAVMRFSLPIGANRAYDWSLPALIGGTGRITDAYMTGNISHYLGYILAACLAVVGLPVVLFGFASEIFTADLARIELIEIAMTAITVAAAILAATMKKRVHVILALGAAGYMVSMFFVMFSAPDLALTQLLVETVTLILYVMVLRQFPSGMDPAPERQDKPAAKCGRLLISAAVGASMFFISMFAHSHRLFETISFFFTHNSLRLGGGKNVVNVTLVDFRGLDTMGEISVLCMAALGVYILTSLYTDSSGKTRAEERHSGPQDSYVPGNDNDIVILTLAKPISFVILFVSVYLFSAGHNNPGGGFIAGLMTASALLLMYITEGKRSIERLPAHLSSFLPIGLSVAVACGLGGVLAGRAFLTHTFGHYTISALGGIHLEVATAMIFDFGVFLVVIGAVMSIIYNIGKSK